jgi:hypothetical protein
MPRLRSLMLWLVVLAVPLQGLAAATMLNCAAVHGPSSVALDHAGHGDHDHGSVAAAVAATSSSHGTADKGWGAMRGLLGRVERSIGGGAQARATAGARVRRAGFEVAVRGRR